MRRIPFNRGWETRPNADFFAEVVGAVEVYSDADEVELLLDGEWLDIAPAGAITMNVSTPDSDDVAVTIEAR